MKDNAKRKFESISKSDQIIQETIKNKLANTGPKDIAISEIGVMTCSTEPSSTEPQPRSVRLCSTEPQPPSTPPNEPDKFEVGTAFTPPTVKSKVRMRYDMPVLSQTALGPRCQVPVNVISNINSRTVKASESENISANEVSSPILPKPSATYMTRTDIPKYVKIASVIILVVLCVWFSTCNNRSVITTFLKLVGGQIPSASEPATLSRLAENLAQPSMVQDPRPPPVSARRVATKPLPSFGRPAAKTNGAAAGTGTRAPGPAAESAGPTSPPTQSDPGRFTGPRPAGNDAGAGWAPLRALSSLFAAATWTDPGPAALQLYRPPAGPFRRLLGACAAALSSDQLAGFALPHVQLNRRLLARAQASSGPGRPAASAASA
jgi:hypothetical protein